MIILEKFSMYKQIVKNVFTDAIKVINIQCRKEEKTQ